MHNFRVGQKIRLCPKRYNKEVCKDWEGAVITKVSKSFIDFRGEKWGAGACSPEYILPFNRFPIKINTRKLY